MATLASCLNEILSSTNHEVIEKGALFDNLLLVVNALQHHRARAVPKEDTSVPILPIDPSRQRVAAHNHRVLERAGVQELRGGHRRKQESRAGSGEVECDRIGRTDRLGNRGRIAEEIVGRAVRAAGWDVSCEWCEPGRGRPGANARTMSRR